MTINPNSIPPRFPAESIRPAGGQPAAEGSAAGAAASVPMVPMPAAVLSKPVKLAELEEFREALRKESQSLGKSGFEKTGYAIGDLLVTGMIEFRKAFPQSQLSSEQREIVNKRLIPELPKDDVPTLKQSLQIAFSRQMIKYFG